jgi:hypothetical protein
MGVLMRSAIVTTAKTNDAKSVRILLILHREAIVNEGSPTYERLGLEGIRAGTVQKWQIVANARLSQSDPDRWIANLIAAV